ncbi:hypothetical protein OHC33_008135 [Knufia fluminis]|uniref:Uncharacterized protein n=1 Tax=Knufia fluminis TaxID=191047 RepID=A0AAN8IK26_9EURO|nr:hypothetical protein OHC33_008135 [Knufia fluminis]
MTIIWQAICKSLGIDHDITAKQEPLEDQPQSRISCDPRLHKDVFDLAIELIALKQEIDAAKGEQTRVEEYLLPHKTRFLVLLARYRSIRTYFQSLDDEVNLELVVSRIERMETGIEEIEREILAKEEAIERLKSVYDAIIRRIMKRTQLRPGRTHSRAGITEHSVVTETMVLSESLDTFEDQAMEIEDEMLAEAPEQCYQDRDEIDDTTDHDDAISFTSEDFEAKERVELFKELGQLKFQRSELKEDPTIEASAAEEIEALTKQINDLGDEIAIRGAPCIEGSIVWQNDYINEGETAQDVPQSPLEQDVDNVSGAAIAATHKATKEYTGPGLFDGVVDIEAPDDDSLSEEERFLTEAERIERFEKSVNKVKGWLNQLACAGKLHSPDAEGEVSNANFEGSNELEDVEWGETNSEYLPGSSDFAGVTLRCRIDSWSRICERFYRELDSEGQAAHPRGTSPV